MSQVNTALDKKLL